MAGPGGALGPGRPGGGGRRHPSRPAVGSPPGGGQRERPHAGPGPRRRRPDRGCPAPAIRCAPAGDSGTWAGPSVRAPRGERYCRSSWSTRGSGQQTPGLAPPPSIRPRSSLLLLSVALFGLFSTNFNVSVLAIVVPRLVEDFDAPPSTVSWLVVGPTLAYAVLGPTAGKLGDLYGRRRVYLIGLAGCCLVRRLHRRRPPPPSPPSCSAPPAPCSASRPPPPAWPSSARPSPPSSG